MSDKRFVGRAGVPDDPPTEPLIFVQPPPPPPRRRRSAGLIAGLIAGAFIILLFGVMTGYALRFGDISRQGAPPPPPASPTAARKASPTPPPDTPKAATERFLTAVVDGDETVMRQNLCRLLRGDDKASPKPGTGIGWLTGRLVGFKVGEEKVTGPAATVDVQATMPIIGETKFSVYLLREDGTWRVCGGGPA